MKVKGRRRGYVGVLIQQEMFTAYVECEAVKGIPFQVLLDEGVAAHVGASVSSYMEDVTEKAGNA